VTTARWLLAGGRRTRSSPRRRYPVGRGVPQRIAALVTDGRIAVQLSPAYDGDAAEARGRGWPVAGEVGGGHLDVATAPARVADLVGDL
jgi:hypothetical protein